MEPPYFLKSSRVPSLVFIALFAPLPALDRPMGITGGQSPCKPSLKSFFKGGGPVSMLPLP